MASGGWPRLRSFSRSWLLCMERRLSARTAACLVAVSAASSASQAGSDVAGMTGVVSLGGARRAVDLVSCSGTGLSVLCTSLLLQHTRC